MAKYFIVWNESKTEGFATTDEQDAKQCETGNFLGISSTVGEAFVEAYEDDKRTIERVGF